MLSCLARWKNLTANVSKWRFLTNIWLLEVLFEAWHLGDTQLQLQLQHPRDSFFGKEIPFESPLGYLTLGKTIRFIVEQNKSSKLPFPFSHLDHGKTRDFSLILKLLYKMFNKHTKFCINWTILWYILVQIYIFQMVPRKTLR